MDTRLLIDGLIMYLGLIVLLTFHEFGHAWMASRCGDDTARSEGRVSLNPLAHIDPIGTVVMPLLMIFLSLNGSGLGRFLVGWAKPVPVNPYNLRNPKVDDILVTLAGPWMNFLLAIVAMALARVGILLQAEPLVEISMNLAYTSLLLCFFNLLPVPPLDGSQVARSVLGISHEAYYQVARYGFVILIVVLQIPFVKHSLNLITFRTFALIGGWFGIHLPF